MRELTAKEAVFCKAIPEPVAALGPWRTGRIHAMRAPGIFNCYKL